MQKVNISIQKDALLFSYCDTPSKTSNLLNTNIINSDELVFSAEYLTKNKKIVALFLNDLLKEHNLKKIIITDYVLSFITIDIIAKIDNVSELVFLEENSLPFDLCEKILDNKNIKHINCSSIPPFMLEMLDRNNLRVETRCEVFFTSSFMSTNNLTQYSKIYYKTNIRIENELTKTDFEDFESFCKINRYLKIINLYFYDLNILEQIINILHSQRIKNIKILLHKNITNPNLINELKKLNKTYKAKYGITLKIIYSENYLQENIVTQVALNFLKTCSLVILLIAATIFTTICINNYLAFKKVENITTELTEIIKKQEPADKEETDNNKISNKFLALLDINNDTAGWLKVNDTTIDYPVVKGLDNSFYLGRDYHKNRDYNGWVFMDYRNNFENLDKNTIIYGHNRYNSSVMFGTLQKATKKEWYTNEENQIISFNTIYQEYNWQIFSIYKIDTTSDYIQTTFTSDEEYTIFLNMIQKRSIYDFKIDLSADTKILTLSTCLDNNKRLVVHAALIEE